MRSQQRSIRLVMALVASTALAAGCTTGGTTSPTPNPSTEAPTTTASPEAPAAIQGEVKVWMVTRQDSQLAAWEELVKAFEDANPGVTVTTEFRGTDEHTEALRRAAGTSAAPDIYWLFSGPGAGGELVNLGLSADLTEEYARYGWDKLLTGPALQAVTMYGGHHGVPWSQAALAMFYNKELLEQAGVTSEPSNYDELVAAADKLKAAGITPLALGGTVGWHMMRLLDSIIETTCGSAERDALYSFARSWADAPCLVEAYTELKRWGDNYMPEGFMGLGPGEASDMFFANQAAMTLEGSYMGTAIVDNGMDPHTITVAPFPTGTNRIYSFGVAMYLSADSSNRDAAVAFLDHFISTEMQQNHAVAWNAIPVNVNVVMPTDNPVDAAWGPIVANSSGIFLPSDAALASTTTQEFFRVQNAVLLGEIAPADAPTAMQTFFDNQ